MPLRGIYFLNLFQSFIIAFLVCDIQRKRKKAETREVLSARPIDNGQSFLGETLGILIPFLIIDAIFMITSMIINIFIPYSPVNLWVNLFYLFTYTLPTLIFITGLSLFVNKLIKNSLFSWLILVVFLYLAYNYLATPFYGILDFQGRLLPNSFSTMVGFVHLSNYLLHRGTFLLLGGSFLYFGVLLVKRLPGNTSRRHYLIVPGTLLLVLSLCLGFIYVEKFQTRRANRIKYRETFLKYVDNPKARVLAHDITYQPEGDKFSATSQIRVQNQKKVKIDQLLLFLNPGLKINKIESNGQDLPFRRDHQVVVIEHSLIPNEKTELKIEYEGNIDEDIYQVNIPDDEYFSPIPYSCEENYGKRPAFVSSKFTFLRPEVMWYPAAVPSLELQASRETNFTSYTLHVKKKGKLTVLSQGVPNLEGDFVTFNNLQNLTGLTLCIGEYEKKALTIDSLTVELYTYPGNNFYTKYFNEWDILKQANPDREKKLKEIFNQCKNQIENGKTNAYPFKYFKLIEVPSSSYFTSSTSSSDRFQPEIVHFRERLCRLESENPGTYQPSKDSDESVQEYLLNYKIPFLLNLMRIEHIFSDYNSSITSDTYQGIELIFKRMMNPKISTNSEDIMSPKILNHIAAKGLKEIIAEEYSHTQDIAITSKVSHLLSYLTTTTTWDSLTRFMQTFNTHTRFREVNFDSFIEKYEQYFGQNIKTYMDEWYTTLEVPLLSIKDISRKTTENTQIIDFKIGNFSETDGIVSIIASDYQFDDIIRNCRSYLIKPGECKRIVVHEDIKYALRLTTNFSGCFPKDISFETGKSPLAGPVANEGVTSLHRTQFYPPGEIIVDNEDKNFHLIDSANNRKRLTDLIKKEDNLEYIAFYHVKGNTWNLPLLQEFYGDYIRGAFVKKASTGKFKAEWVADLPEAGKYEIFVHRPHICESIEGQYHATDYPGMKNYYTVYTPEGKEEIILEAQEVNVYYPFTLPLPAEEAWVSLGLFSLPTGESRVILDDRGIAPFLDEKYNRKYTQLVVADAVKWVKIK